MRVWVLFLFVMVLLLPVVSAQGVSGDADGDGCVTITEVSAYVAQWLNGQVTLTQVSQAVSAWLQGCTPPPSGGSLYSAAYPLTWSSTPVNTGFVGAEFNPTGDPIGGYHGYRRIVHPSQANFVVHNKDEFLAALAQVQPGQIIYVDDNAVIDLSGTFNIPIPGNITIASGRGRNFSKGALMKNLEQLVWPSVGGVHFYTTGPNIRITGLRFEGPGKTSQQVRHAQIFYFTRPDNIAGSYYHMIVSHLINVRNPFVEIDNCEFFGWTYAAIALGYSDPVYPAETARDIWVHHNFFHHNAHAGLGYGVAVGGGSNVEREVTALIEANLFDYNRHSIASSNPQYSSYEARYNLQLPESFSIPFDRHGGGGQSGTHTIIHHNTDRFMKEDRGSIGITNPGYPPGISQAYNNWVYKIRPLESIGNINYPGQVLIFGNFFNHFAPAGTVLPEAKISVNKDVVKVGEAVGFDASESTGGTYGLSYVCWKYGDLSEEECGLPGAIFSHSYSAPGRYTIRMRAFDVKGVFDETLKSVVVLPNDPTRVILSFWMRDSFNQYNTDDAPGYFRKSVLVDGQEVWGKDLYEDGWEWEQIVVDITSYVSDNSVIDFQVRSLQNYQRQNYPSYHPFDFFEVYIDDVYVFNRDYSVENFGNWEVDANGNDYTGHLNETQTSGNGVNHFYNEGGEGWWKGSVLYEDRVSGGYSFVIRSGYRENSVANSVRGIRKIVKAPKVTEYINIENNHGTLRDVSLYSNAVSFMGMKDVNNNDILDFYGYSKKFNGVDNYFEVNNFDLSRDYVLEMNVFLPNENDAATLMYATNGNNYVHIYYAPTNIITIKGNSFETTCSLPQLSHSKFNKIVVGRSCSGSTCTLSCANNGVVNSFASPPSYITLSGTSTVSFGGYSGSATNLLGAIKYGKLLKGPLQSSVFQERSKLDLLGGWYFRDGTNGIIKDASDNNQNVDVSGASFGTEGQRKFIQFQQSGPSRTIPRDLAFNVGEKFSVEFIFRFEDFDSGFNVVSGEPITLYKAPYSAPGWPGSRKLFMSVKMSEPLYFMDHHLTGWYNVRTSHQLESNKWHHVVFVKDGDYLNSYLNGELNRKIYVPGIPYDASAFSNLIIGNFNGDVSRFVIFDKALRESDVEALYTSSLLGCSDSDSDGYGAFPRSGVINGCRFDGFDCNDNSASVYPGAGCS